MGRRREREVERARVGADEPRDGHRDDVAENQFGQRTGHRLLRAVPWNRDHDFGEKFLILLISINYLFLKT